MTYKTLTQERTELAEHMAAQRDQARRQRDFLVNAMKRLLKTIDSGSWRDRTELSIAAHPAVDDARQLLIAIEASA